MYLDCRHGTSVAFDSRGAFAMGAFPVLSWGEVWPAGVLPAWLRRAEVAAAES